jgi:AraC family transcriptional regulator
VHDILFTDDRVLDIAIKYGYESPESFTRAFRKAYGQPPAIARRIRPDLNCFGAVNLIENGTIKIIGGINVNYSIIEKPVFYVAGKGITLGSDVESNQRRIPQFWDEVCSDGCLESILTEKVVNPNIVLGICLDFAESGGFTYFIGVEVNTKVGLPEGLEIKEIPAAKYAVFTAKGPIPSSVQQALGEIYGKWFPSSEYTREEKPDFELYDEKRTTLAESPESAEVDLYIPVK